MDLETVWACRDWGWRPGQPVVAGLVSGRRVAARLSQVVETAGLDPLLGSFCNFPSRARRAGSGIAGFEGMGSAGAGVDDLECISDLVFFGGAC